MFGRFDLGKAQSKLRDLRKQRDIINEQITQAERQCDNHLQETNNLNTKTHTTKDTEVDEWARTKAHGMWW